MIEVPQSFVVSSECKQAAWTHGFRKDLGQENGWVAYGSTTAAGTLFLAAAGPGGPWYAATDHAGVVGEFSVPKTAMAGPGHARYSVDRMTDLYPVLQRIYELAVSLPDSPLKVFEKQIADVLPNTTEVERIVKQRIGQDIFRDRLMKYWKGSCPMTGIADPDLLRASHIKPWKTCETDAERLDVHNGLLLSALWDAAFDKGHVTFDND